MNEVDTCIYLCLYKQYFNWWWWHQRKSKKCFHSLSSYIYIYIHVCHFIISFLLFTEQDVETRNKKNEEQTVCMYVCMYVCLWPIGIVYMHVAHTNTNGISLCCRHSRPTKKKRTRKRERERKHIVLCLSTDAGRN
jgi:hypothetical protein